MEEEISNKKVENESRNLKPLEVVGIIALFFIALFLITLTIKFVEGKNDKISSLELTVDSLKARIDPLIDSLAKENKQKRFFAAESDYRLHYLIKEEGPTKNTEEYRGPCKLYTYKEVMDSFEIVENRYRQLLWNR